MLASIPISGLAQDRAKPSFRTFFVTRSMASDRLFPYLDTAKPELVQIGQYGAMFHGYADNEKSTGTPMQLPFSGERKVLDFQRDLNVKLHERGHQVVGHFRLIKVMGNWEERTGFVDYYDNRWPEDLLGPKPHPDLAELLARDSKGTPIPLSRYGKGQLGFCLSSPHARQMFKQMLKVAVDHGVDGVITTYNYRYDCVCPYCHDEFKTWLWQNQSADEIREKLGIEDLEAHQFESIPAKITGYPIDPEDPEATTELDWLAMRWGAEHFKQAWDEIFIDYGRSLKKDLIVARWDHLSQVSLKEERNFVPLDQWGKGEDYFWYSGGASFVGKKLNLAEGMAGDAWLSSLYVRELGGGKPFVMGKYDAIRMEASMAEGFATGGLGMGRYMKFEDPHAFEKLVQYTNFRHKHRDLYDGGLPFADVALVLPRQSVWNRRPDALDEFRALGQALVERQVLLDVLVDERITPECLSKYPAVILPKTVSLSGRQIEALRSHASSGRLVVIRGSETGILDEVGKPRVPSPEIPGAVFENAAEIDSTDQPPPDRVRIIAIPGASL